ncbi:pilus assembly protein PilP [Tahibacter amnicola]|uniref:Pilus assembly protein PilP n=1 Tax=Tahibacter amnicola TaxID=2976241 RepID=A0ABY6BDV3_9GAMM|nr:pilus assembly protein PilP [Tahibacter amnicola]UXI68208.1 pilus assembly protein PilP [Tahibacter amnicola]
MSLARNRLFSAALGAFAIAIIFDARASRWVGALEQFDIVDLAVVSVHCRRVNDCYANVLDPNGFVHHLSPGEFIGRNQGKVNKIEKCAIHFVELYKNSDGVWYEKENELRFSDEYRPAGCP